MEDIPTWLNEQFIEKIIKNSDLKSEMAKIVKISVAPATAKGDNYSSVMIRVTIDYANTKLEMKKKSIVIKLSPQKEGVQKDLVSLMSQF